MSDVAQFTTEQKLPVMLEVDDGFGAAVKIDGVPVVTISDETVAKSGGAVQDADGVWGLDLLAGAPGTATVTVAVDADLGEGVNTILGVLAIEVVMDPRSEQRIVKLVAKAPVDKGPPPPAPVV